jgi:hypothetical protein
MDFIEFLVRRKYPSPRVSRAPRPFGRAYGYSGTRESAAEARRDKEVSDYKEALRALPAEDFAALLNSEQVKEAAEIQAKAAGVEKARFFNQSHANADISFWSKAAYWTLEEAIALSFGKNPELVNWDRLKGMQFESPFVEKYRKLRDLAFRAKWIEKLYDPVLPSIYLRWIKENKLEFPEHLEAALVAHGCAFFDWKANYDQLFAIYESHKEDWRKIAEDWRSQALEAIQERDVARDQLATAPKEATTPEIPLGKRERESMLKLIAAMAIGGYGHDPKAARSDTVKSIVDDLERAGMMLSDDTVRRYLNDAMDFMRESLA